MLPQYYIQGLRPSECENQCFAINSGLHWVDGELSGTDQSETQFKIQMIFIINLLVL